MTIKQIPPTICTEHDFIKYQSAKNRSGFNWAEFIMTCMDEFIENHYSGEFNDKE